MAIQGEPVLWIPRRPRLLPQSGDDDVVTANKFAVLRAVEEDHVQAVSVGRDPAHVPGYGRVAV